MDLKLIRGRKAGVKSFCVIFSIIYKIYFHC